MLFCEIYSFSSFHIEKINLVITKHTDIALLKTF